MYLLIALVYLLADKAVFSREYTNEKCCGAGEYLTKNDNNTYQCTENTSKRLDVLTNSTNFLETRSEGVCIDVSTNFSVFKIEGDEVIETDTTDEYFRKCCPLNYIYNSVSHSCIEKENLTHSFIREHFIKVGLPDCKLIVDRELKDEIDIYGSIINTRRNHDYCIDENEKGLFVVRECNEDIQECDHIRCVKKCCPDGQSFVNGPNCVDTYTNGLNLSFSSLIESPDDPFAVISNRTCKRIYLLRENRYIFKLGKNGTFTYWFNFTNSFIHDDIGEKFSYCIEHSTGKKAQGFFFFQCFKEKEFKQKFQYTLVPKILSCVFLVLTILIYIILNETRNLFGKILMNYCIGTLLLFSLLVYAHTDLASSDISCKLTGFSIIFFSTVTYAWLNIMCCDIWWTFGHFRQSRENSFAIENLERYVEFVAQEDNVCRSTKQSVGVHQRKKDLRRLLLYMIYGWGMPVILTLIIYLCSRSEVIPYKYRPFVGFSICFIENRKGNYATVLYLRLPHLIIQIVNTTLYFKTILYCLRIKNEINKINDTTKHEKRNSFKKDKERLSLILKLSVIMGVTYIFEVMTSFCDMSEMGTVAKYIEIIWDCINSLQGVFVFIIFICKKKVYYDFLRKINVSKGRSFNNTQSLTSSTRMSILNSTSTSNRKSSRIM